MIKIIGSLVVIVFVFSGAWYIYNTTLGSNHNKPVSTITESTPKQSENAVASNSTDTCGPYKVNLSEVVTILGDQSATEKPAFDGEKSIDEYGGCAQLFSLSASYLHINVSSFATGDHPTLRNDVNGPCSIDAPSLGIGDDSCFNKFNDSWVNFLKGNISGQVYLSEKALSNTDDATKRPTRDQLVSIAKAAYAKLK